MGSCCSTDESSAEARRYRKAVNNAVRNYHWKQWGKEGAKFSCKVLLTGISGSGKTAFARQSECLLAENVRDVEHMKTMVYQSVYISIRALLKAVEILQLEFESKQCRRCAEVVYTCQEPVMCLTAKELIAIKRLWMDQAVQRCHRERDEHGLDIPHYASHFLNSVDRFVDNDYSPSMEDILQLTTPTTEISEYSLRAESGRLIVRMIDMGGHPSERRKWINCFSDCTAILYLVDVSEVIDRPKTTTVDNCSAPPYSSLEESKALFRTLLQIGDLDSVPMFLVLNKFDLLAEKISQSDVVDHCYAYGGSKLDPEAACSFVLNQFLGNTDYRHIRIAPVLTFAVSSTNTEEVKFVLKVLLSMMRPEGSLDKRWRTSRLLV